MAMNASGTLIDSMKPNATTAIAHWTRMSGANVMYICTDRMSEFALEISWPDWHAVVEGERHPREVLVDDVPQVELDVVGGLEEEEPRDVAVIPPTIAEPDDPRTRRSGAAPVWLLERVVDRLVQQVGDLDLQDEPDE